ncbi:hypothetical protein GCM10010420_51120 [Streptomyces glaucosporus]|uniref:Uncharacterized protein n=1 Tax=Streptomyces glaucosporus TaxID=284044 RepID=A0ABN3IVE3_9ACTN
MPVRLPGRGPGGAGVTAVQGAVRGRAVGARWCRAPTGEAGDRERPRPRRRETAEGPGLSARLPRAIAFR